MGNHLQVDSNIAHKFAFCSTPNHRHIVLVHPEYQRRGAGSALLERVIELADSTRSSVFVRDASQAGMNLYLSHGFKHVDNLVIEGYESEIEPMVGLYRAYAGSSQSAGPIATAEPAVGVEGDVERMPASEPTPSESGLTSSGDTDTEAAVLVSPGIMSEGRSEDDYVSVSR